MTKEHMFAAVGDEIYIKTIYLSRYADGRHVYEIGPDTYTGPWRLKQGTRLRVVSVPDTPAKDTVD